MCAQQLFLEQEMAGNECPSHVSPRSDAILQADVAENHGCVLASGHGWGRTIWPSMEHSCQGLLLSSLFKAKPKTRAGVAWAQWRKPPCFWMRKHPRKIWRINVTMVPASIIWLLLCQSEIINVIPNDCRDRLQLQTCQRIPLITHLNTWSLSPVAPRGFNSVCKRTQSLSIAQSRSLSKGSGLDKTHFWDYMT